MYQLLKAFLKYLQAQNSVGQDMKIFYSCIVNVMFYQFLKLAYSETSSLFVEVRTKSLLITFLAY